MKMRRFSPFLVLLLLLVQPRWALALETSLPHGIVTKLTTLRLTASSDNVEIRYTLDGSMPTASSQLYTKPIVLSKTTVLRAVEMAAGEPMGSVLTATYIFPQSVLHQSNEPEGYPATWGKYAQLKGTVKADYEMDPEIVDEHADDIRQSLYELPLLSLVSDKECFFGQEEDEERGGIYVFTGSPVGRGVGRGWERPVSVELIGGPQQHDLTIDCAITLHGGHGRLPEKNPKHSFRLKFKSDYGPAKLDYPLFGPDGAQSFNQLILRTFFGNAWQHWKEDGRQRAQYTRDLWARRMQHQMGHPFADGFYVHLFINGLYWGLYNVAERIDDSYCKEHFGGKKDDYDVIKVEETGGRHTVEAADGTMDKWSEMLQLVGKASQDRYYYQLQGLNTRGERDASLEPLLDVDGFIDYMLINHYGGNTDWDVHNWFAFRNRTAADRGFQFICWDSESLFEGLHDNRLTQNNAGCPSEMFQQLMRNRHFQNRYMERAHQLLTGQGLLTEQSVVALWDSLYHTIEASLYAESARWGDYRRDVHPYQTRGELYTVEGAFAAERQRLLTSYFPQRSQLFLSQLEQMGWYSTGMADVSVAAPADDAPFFNLSGQRLRPVRRGLYIKDRRIVVAGQ